MKSNSEQDIIRACQDGETWAYKAIFDKYSAAMLSVCMRYLNRRDLAEDVLQEGFIRLFDKIHQYSGRGYFAGWVKRIFVNLSLNELTKNNALQQSISIDEVETLNLTSNSNFDVLGKIEADEIHTIISQLPDNYRTIFNMIGIEGYSYKEVAKLLNVNENCLRTSYHRARKILQERIKKQIGI